MAEEEAGSVNDTLGIPNKISTLCGFGDGATANQFFGVFFLHCWKYYIRC